MRLDEAGEFGLLAEQWLLCLFTHLIQIKAAVKTLHTEGHSSHDGLLLLDDELGVAAYGTQVYVILDAQRKHQERGQKQQEANAEAV